VYIQNVRPRLSDTRYSAKGSATILHTPKRRPLASIPLFAYNFSMDGPIWTMKIYINNQSTIAFIHSGKHRAKIKYKQPWIKNDFMLTI